MKFQNVIKWSGSKRTQSEEIIKTFPSKINTYYEPFVGGGSVLYQLLNSDISVKNYICSDINNDLISLWNTIKNNPVELANYYETLWNELNTDENIERKKEYFNKVRNRFNKERNPMDFMFIIRTTTNGLIRYNKKGDFNNSFHFNRKGINPLTLRKIILDWSKLLNEKHVTFIHQSYISINSSKDDFIYLDPPYYNTKGMYYGKINFDEFFTWLGLQEANYSLSFDGICGEVDNTFNIPCHLYSKHLYLKSGCSSFRRLKNKNIKQVVESLYVK